MPSRRVVALAQALMSIMLLAPGLPAGLPGTVEAALRPAEPAVGTILDATGKGIGCEVGRRRFKGPRKPTDPPWPPGTKPSATPQPTPVEPDAAEVPASPEAVASPDPTTEEPAEEPTADVSTKLLAGSAIRVAQADPSAEPTDDAGAEPDPVDSDAGDVDLEPDVETAPETMRQGRRSRLIKGIDVSHHNGDIDYGKVHRDGNRFVFIKATQDNAFIDPMFPTNLVRARAAGLAAGAYHFFDYTLDGTVQADHFLDRVEAFGGIEGSLPPVVDVECWGPIGSSLHVVTEARLRDFVERIYERTGRLPIVYTSVFMWDEVVGNAEGFEDLPLWAACWGCDLPPSLAPGWDDWAFWQTGVGRVRGVGRLDANFFSGDPEELEALRLRPFAIEGGAEVTGSERVGLDLGGRDASHYRTSPDGETWSRWMRSSATPEVELAPEDGDQTVFVQLRVSPEMVSPVLSDSITLDRSGPVLSEPVVTLRPGLVVEAAVDETPPDETRLELPVSVSWTAIDAHAGLSDASVSIVCGDAPAERIEAPGSAAPGELVTWDATASLVAEAGCAITAIGMDGVGNASRRTAQGIEATVMPASDGEGLSAVVSGSQVGVIARRGPDGGQATIRLDGRALGTVDLYSPLAGEAEVVFVADLDPDVDQELRVEATGTADPASSGTEVAVDGFVTLGQAPTPVPSEAPAPSEAAAPSEAPAPSEAAAPASEPTAPGSGDAAATSDPAIPGSEGGAPETGDPASETDEPAPGIDGS